MFRITASLIIVSLGLISLSAIPSSCQAQTLNESVTGNSPDNKREKIRKTFAQLRDERSDLLAGIPRLRSDRDRIASLIRGLEEEEISLQSTLRLAPNTKMRNIEVIQREEDLKRLKLEKSYYTKEYEAKVKRAQNELESARANQKTELLPELEYELERVTLRHESSLHEFDSRVRVAEAELENLKNRTVLQTQELTLQLENLRANKENQKNALRDLESKLQIKTDRQFEVENEINLLLIPQTAENRFKLYITIAFASLVGVVIIGFFFMAFTDDIVRRAIFSGQAGIQFLTLFSLVIAIILFGMTGILGDKELSALLGGISGYILGRVTPNS